MAGRLLLLALLAAAAFLAFSSEAQAAQAPFQVADLKVSYRDGWKAPAIIEPDATISIPLRVTNTGPAAARAVDTYVTILEQGGKLEHVDVPAGCRVTTRAGWSWAYLDCYRDLAAGESRDLTIKLKWVRAGNVLVVPGASSIFTRDLHPADNQARFTVTAKARPVPVLTLGVGATPVEGEPGAAVSAVVRVSNVGVVDAKPALVSFRPGFDVKRAADITMPAGCTLAPPRVVCSFDLVAKNSRELSFGFKIPQTARGALQLVARTPVTATPGQPFVEGKAIVKILEPKPKIDPKAVDVRVEYRNGWSPPSTLADHQTFTIPVKVSNLGPNPLDRILFNLATARNGGELIPLVPSGCYSNPSGIHHGVACFITRLGVGESAAYDLPVQWGQPGSVTIGLGVNFGWTGMRDTNLNDNAISFTLTALPEPAPILSLAVDPPATASSAGTTPLLPIHVRNLGPGTARGMELTFVEGGGWSQIGDYTAGFGFDGVYPVSIPAGATGSMVVHFRLSASNAQTVEATVTIPIAPGTPRIVPTIKEAPESLRAGETGAIVVQLDNLGDGPSSASTIAFEMTGAQLSTFPDGWRRIDGAAANAVLPPLAPGASVTYRFEIVPIAGQTSAVVTLLGGDFAALSRAIVVEPAKADLQLATFRASSSSVRMGESITVTLAVKNLGPSSASSVIVEAEIPSGLAIAVDEYGPCVKVGQKLRCSFGTIASGDTVTHDFTVSAPAPGTYTTTAAASASDATQDPDASNDTRSLTVTVTA